MIRRLQKNTVGLSDTLTVGLSDVIDQINSDRFQVSVEEYPVRDRMIRHIQIGSVELIIGAFCKEDVLGIEALPSGSDDPTQRRTNASDQ